MEVWHNSMIETFPPSIGMLYSQVLHSPVREVTVILSILLESQRCALHFTKGRCVCFRNTDRSSIHHIHNGRIIILSHIIMLNYKGNFFL